MHESWSEPGSVASMDCIKSFPRFAVQEISADKMIMGTPSYGYDWDVTNPDQNAMKQWDEIQTYDLTDSFDNFSYTDQIIISMSSGMKMKSSLAKEYCLVVSVYSLGHESEFFWQAVQKGYEKEAGIIHSSPFFMKR
ncbi:hypothetical protein ACSYGW_18800 [Bacillus glycinifermentans]|uniref:hypothetical protein n=1 Tax=Bacillus glycinifermentans TaxID=1664069 RepID=UPI004059A0A8